jgi:hypothetical protein
VGTFSILARQPKSSRRRVQVVVHVDSVDSAGALGTFAFSMQAFLGIVIFPREISRNAGSGETAVRGKNNAVLFVFTHLTILYCLE